MVGLSETFGFGFFVGVLVGAWNLINIVEMNVARGFSSKCGASAEFRK